MSKSIFDGWERGSVQTLSGDEVPTGAVIFLADDGMIEIDDTPHAGAIADAIMALPDMLAALHEARLQIEYLHEKFQKTGSGETTLFKIRLAIARAEGQGV